MLKLLILIYFILFNTCIANETKNSDIEEFISSLNEINIVFSKEYDSLENNFCLKKGKIKVYKEDTLHYSVESLPFIFIHYNKTESDILDVNYSLNFSLLLSKLEEELLINKFDRLNIPHLIFYISDKDFKSLYLQEASGYKPVSKDNDKSLSTNIKKIEISSDLEIPVVLMYKKLSKSFRCSSVGDSYLRLIFVYMPVKVIVYKSSIELIESIFHSHIKSIERYVSEIKKGIKMTIRREGILKKLQSNLIINYYSLEQYLQLR